MKKQFLTLALLATVALGGAFAENANSKSLAITGGPQNFTPGAAGCSTSLPCNPTPNATPCIIEDVQYYTKTNQTSTGTCTVLLYRDL